MSFTLLGILQSQAAGGAAAAYDLLETQALTSSASSVTFTGLGSYSDYKHLQIRYTIQYINGTTGTTAMNLQFNNDTGSNYAKHQLTGNGSTVTSGATTSSSNIQLSDAGTRPSETSFGAGVIDILDFSSSAKNTTIKALYGAITPSEDYVYLTSGLWNSTSAVTSIKHFSVSGFSFATGSRFSLYGIKGA